MSEFSVSEADGNVVISNAEVNVVLAPDDARKLARMLLSSAEAAQAVRSRRGDGMPERVTLNEMEMFRP